MPLRFVYSDLQNFSNPGASGLPALRELLQVQNERGQTLLTLTDDGLGNISFDVSGILTQNGLSLAGAFTYKGAIDCSSNPNWPAANAGDVYKISVAGKIGGASGQTVQAKDVLICNVTGVAGTDAAVGANWMIEQGNVVSTADVPDSTDKRYVTDAQRTVIGNTSGTNTGDHITTITEAEAASTIALTPKPTVYVPSATGIMERSR